MKSSVFSTSIKWASVPVLFAFLLRYGPGYFYGNTRIYDKPIAYEIVDDFLSENNIKNLREWIFTERRFATAVEATARGVDSIGEDEPINPDGSCTEMTFSAGAHSSTCKLIGRSDIGFHFFKTGGHRGMKETVDKLMASGLSFLNYYPDKVSDPEIKELFQDKEYLVRNQLKSRKRTIFSEKSWKHLPRWLGHKRATKRRRFYLPPDAS